MDEMEFDSFTIRKVQLPLKEPFEISSGKIKDRNIVILEGKKDDERFYGEASPQFAPLYNHETADTAFHVVKEFAVPAVRNASTIKEYHRIISRYKGNNLAFAAGDFLIHHRKSVRQRESLKNLFGGQEDFSLVGASIGLQKSPEHLVEKVSELRSEGYRRFKLKIKPGYDIEFLEAVRGEFPDLDLMVDANTAYSDKASLIEDLDRFDLEMIEQPLGPNDFYNHSILAERIDTPLCLDESIRTPEDVEKASEIGACEIVNLKPQRVRGLHHARKIVEKAEMEGLGLWVGSVVESGIGKSFSLAATSCGTDYPNDLAPNEKYFEEGLLEKKVEMDDGEIGIGSSPGLRSKVSRENLEKFTVRKEVLKNG